MSEENNIKQKGAGWKPDIPDIGDHIYSAPGSLLVEDAKNWTIESKTIVIDENNCKALIGQMRTAKQKDTRVLDKDRPKTKSATFDPLESFQQAIKYFERI